MSFRILILLWATYFNKKVRFYGLPHETCGVGSSVFYSLVCDRHIWWVQKIISTALYQLLTKRVWLHKAHIWTKITSHTCYAQLASLNTQDNWKINNPILSNGRRMPYVSFQHCFHLKKCKILLCKAHATKLCWRRRSFDKCELTFDNSAVSFKSATLKKESISKYPYSWATQCKEGFHGFPSRNELYTVSFCLEHSLACDRHIWWLTKPTILKSL